jgi:steroid 5-alpha reductase family enzyme
MTGDYDELTGAIDARRRYVTRRWIVSMLRGQEGLGDTFWVGCLGTWFVAAPLAVLGAVLLRGVGTGPSVLTMVQVVFFGALAAWFLALTRAVWCAARRSPQVGAWRWAGLAIALVQGLACLALALLPLAGG